MEIKGPVFYLYYHLESFFVAEAFGNETHSVFH